MTSGFVMLLAFSLPLAAQAAKDEKAKTDWDNLQGSWRITSGDYYGSQQETSSTRRLVIVGDAFIFEEDGRVLSRGKFKLNPSRNPKGVDIEGTEGRVASRGMKSLGIYKLNGDTVVWCWAELGSTNRPKDFIAHASHPRNGVLTFRREKP